jgi:hypothetical protein
MANPERKKPLIADAPYNRIRKPAKAQFDLAHGQKKGAKMGMFKLAVQIWENPLPTLKTLTQTSNLL